MKPLFIVATLLTTSLAAPAFAIGVPMGFPNLTFPTQTTPLSTQGCSQPAGRHVDTPNVCAVPAE